MLRQQRRLGRGDLGVDGHWLRQWRGGESQELDPARARRVALDVALLRQRLQDVRHRLRRLDTKALTDLADARLIRILREKIEEIVVDASFDRTQWFSHTSSVHRIA